MDISELDELNTSEPVDELEVLPEVDDTQDESQYDIESSEEQLNDDYGDQQSGAPVNNTETGETSELSGIEAYLSQFDIEGGMVSFEDGEQVHFNDLDSDKQAEILSQLHNASAADIEDKYGLDEEEIGLINYLRQQNTSLDEVIDSMAAQRAETYIMSQQVQDLDISSMNPDSIYTAFLLRSNPEATVDQLEADLSKAKEMSNYDNIVENIRSGLIEERDAFTQEESMKKRDELVAEIESQRAQVVNTVAGLNTIDGLSMNDGIKNEVLDMILNVDEDGDSLFMTHVFSDPQELFRAAFWYKNGADIVGAREDFWKKEKSAAYKRGLEDARLGRKTFIASDVQDRNRTTPHYGDPEEVISLDDLNI